MTAAVGSGRCTWTSLSRELQAQAQAFLGAWHRLECLLLQKLDNAHVINGLLPDSAPGIIAV